MKIHRDLQHLDHIQNAVLTIGSFDGVHLGHQHIIKRLQNIARSIDGETVLLTFDPHPRIVLAEQRGEKPKVRLLTILEEKANLLEYYGIDHLVVIPFTEEFAAQSPEAYIKDFLVAHFHPKKIVIGYDHRFGKGRVGDLEYLKKFEAACGYEVIEISKHEVDDIAVSSTKVRNAVGEGDVALANRLMGHPYRLSGKVISGLKIGRELGYPTANLELAYPYKLIPMDGIYAVLVHHNKRSYKAMLYIGNRPTVDQNLEKTIEVNIFDFQQTIYEEKIQLDFIQFLRGDAKFDSLEALQAQLAADEEAAMKALAPIEL
jgi:riboflavin kinase/FMN adenylyltransferase